MKIMQAPNVATHDQWKNLSSHLSEGETVQIPITDTDTDQLSKLINSSVSQMSNADLHKLDDVVVGTIRLDPKIHLQADNRVFFVGGLAIDKDTAKGAVVGGGVAGLVLSLTDVAAKSVGGYIGAVLSAIALGAVIYPDLAERLRKSEVVIEPNKVTIKPPLPGVPA